MKSDIEVVFFDLGNTLIYEKDPWTPFYERADQALLDVLRKTGLQANQQMYRGFRGLLDLYYQRRGHDTKEETTFVLLKELLKEQGHSDVADETIRSALRAMYSVTRENWHIEEDAIPTLRALKENGFRLGVITNSSDDENTQTLMDKAGIRPYLNWSISSAAFGRRKPHPAIFEAGLRHFGIGAQQAAMVGDTFEADIVGAEQVGMFSVWITRRVHKTVPRFIVRPGAVISKLSEIPALLLA
jgi:putative hydrolase of the HAD superfamily